MNVVTRAAVAGAAGALTTNALHEVTRRLTPDAPRVDLLGMQALAKGLKSLGIPAPVGGNLYRLTLAGDLASNSAYFALVASGPKEHPVAAGGGLGLLAGLGAVYLPPRMSLSEAPTERTTTTKVLTVLLYAAGGLAAGAAFRAMPGRSAEAGDQPPG